MSSQRTPTDSCAPTTVLSNAGVSEQTTLSQTQAFAQTTGYLQGELLQLLSSAIAGDGGHPTGLDLAPNNNNNNNSIMCNQMQPSPISAGSLGTVQGGQNFLPHPNWITFVNTPE